MAYVINNMNVDIKQNTVQVGLSRQQEPARPNDWVNINLNFKVPDDDKQTEGTMEERYRKVAKQLLLEAGNSL